MFRGTPCIITKKQIKIYLKQKTKLRFIINIKQNQVYHKKKIKIDHKHKTKLRFIINIKQN